MAKNGTKTGGRTRGTPNKLTEAVSDLLSSLLAQGLSCDPIEFLARIVANDKAWFGRKSDIPLPLRFKAAAELAPYRAPKRKSIEVKTEGGASPVIIVPEKSQGASWTERAQKIREEQQRVLRERVTK